ncbi:unnamed protein product, partial [Heligmosomoides polygyrus]|uniref:Laminin subunit gamma-1 n=1 Tax=Heligmosomoides polygyrus TaxID=6339 RepID=A0A183GN07_HELPZ
MRVMLKMEMLVLYAAIILGMMVDSNGDLSEDSPRAITADTGYHTGSFPGKSHINRAKANRPIVLMTRILHPASPLKPFRTCVCTVTCPNAIAMTISSGLWSDPDCVDPIFITDQDIVIFIDDIRLEARDLTGCPTCLERIVLDPNPSSQHLEIDLTMVLNELHDQVKSTASHRNEWYNLMSSRVLRGMEVGEKLQLLNQFLLHASLGKERLLRLRTRYMLTDRVYESQTQAFGANVPAREEWLTQKDDVTRKGVMCLVNREVTRLETTIKEVQEYLTHAERELNAKKSEIDAAKILKKNVQVMQEQLARVQPKPKEADNPD